MMNILMGDNVDGWKVILIKRAVNIMTDKVKNIRRIMVNNRFIRIEIIIIITKTKNNYNNNNSSSKNNNNNNNKTHLRLKIEQDKWGQVSKT